MKTKIYPIPSEIPDFVQERDVFGLVNPRRIANHKKFISMVNDTPSGAKYTYAGLRERFLALAVDLVVAAIIAAILEIIIKNWISNYYKYTVIQVIIAGGVWILYNGFFDSSVTQGTIGKVLFQLKVINQDGKRIHFIKASLRSIIAIFSIFSFMAGILLNKKGPGKQLFHDKLLDCYVVGLK